MKIDDQTQYTTSSELEIIKRNLPLEGKRVLELGCGTAVMTRQLAETCAPVEIIATEVDEIQYQKNLLVDDLPLVRFIYGGAQQIDLDDESVDVVIMLKSLHHVPENLMSQGMREIHRVLKPGGLAYFSEPVYKGSFNDILRLFHDEEAVRQHAFQTIKHAVEEGRFWLVAQIFFNTPGHFGDFAEFEERVLKVTHTHHDIDEVLYQRIKQAFEQHLTQDGAHFLKPTRVDLLRKPG